MSHDRLAVPSGGLVLCLCTCYMYKRSGDLGIWRVLGTGKQCEAETETWASARGCQWLVGWLVGWLDGASRGHNATEPNSEEPQSQIETPNQLTNRLTIAQVARSREPLDHWPSIGCAAAHNTVYMQCASAFRTYVCKDRTPVFLLPRPRTLAPGPTTRVPAYLTFSDAQHTPSNRPNRPNHETAQPRAIR